MSVRFRTPMPEPDDGLGAHPLRGGQVWAQLGFPCFTYYLVYLGRLPGYETGAWCRIAPPCEGPGCIAATSADGGPLYTADEMLALLRRENFTYVGQYYDNVSGRIEEGLVDVEG
jgi:hypothetical protein